MKMAISRFLRIPSGIALLSCFMVGCGGDGFDRVSVSGTVTFEGDANCSGSILATPSEGGTDAPNVSAVLTDGKFSFPRDRGPVAGSYFFEIGLAPAEEAASAGVEEGADPEQAGETAPEITYRKTIDIPEGGSDSLSIELTSDDLLDEEQM